MITRSDPGTQTLRYRKLAWIACLVSLLVLIAASPAPADSIWMTSESTRSGKALSHLYIYDLSSHSTVDKGWLDRYWTTDIAVSSTGQLFGAGWRNKNGNGNSELFLINPGDATHTATTTNITTIGGQLSPGINSLSFYGDYLVAGSSDGVLQLLEPAQNGKYRIISSLSLCTGLGGDVAILGNDAFVSLDNGRIGKVHLGSGTMSYDRTLGATGYQQMPGLAFTSDGRLLGLTNDNRFDGPSRLVQLDLVSGLASSATDLGCLNGWGLGSGGAIVAPAAVPEPTTLVLLSLGAVAMLAANRRCRPQLK